MYKLLNNLDGKPYAVFKPNAEGTGGMGIPFDPANTDYVAYLAWCAEGNEPLPAEAPAASTPEQA